MMNCKLRMILKEFSCLFLISMMLTSRGLYNMMCIYLQPIRSRNHNCVYKLDPIVISHSYFGSILQSSTLDRENL